MLQEEGENTREGRRTRYWSMKERYRRKQKTLQEVGESTMGGRRECYRRIQRGLRKKGEVEGGREPHNKGGNVFMGKEGCRSYTIQERDTGGRW